MTVLAVLQARTSSSRLPNKVLRPLFGQPMLARQIERVRRAKRVNAITVATSDRPADEAIVDLCASLGIPCYRGSLDDVLDRFVQAMRLYKPEWIVRLTGDCPLIDPVVIDAAISTALDGGFDYVSNGIEPSYPDGLDVEVIRKDVLETAWHEAILRSEREHVTPFIHQRPERFRIGHLKQERDLSHLRWTVDEIADYELVSIIYERLYPNKPQFDTDDILALLDREPQLAKWNKMHGRNEGYAKSRAEDTL